MDKNSLDNMSGQELKNMIDNKAITLDELDNAALEKIMNFEIDMLCHGSGDMATIRRCSMLLNERNDSETIDKNKIISIIDKVQNEHVTVIDKEEIQNTEAKVIKKRRITLRKVGLIAAILTLMLATSTFVAGAFGIDVMDCFRMIVDGGKGTVVDTDGVTYTNTGEATEYPTIEEMLEKEKLDIMYPTKLPDGIKIEYVSVNRDKEGNIDIGIITNKPGTSCFSIEVLKEPMNESYPDVEIYISGGKTYQIFQADSFYAVCFYDNIYYSIQAGSHDDLILIINNMKE